MILAAIAFALAPARVDWFEYRGRNQDGVAPKAGEYRNPILPGFYSDPSITRVDADYYLVTSTFAYFPGLPVFHSRDLVNWRQIGNALSRPNQVDFKNLELSRGLFAASIEHHNGKFLIVNTCVDCGGNFVLTATNPAGPWSDPIWIKGGLEGAIDPSLFFDADGSSWVVYNGPPPEKPLYDGHRAIWLQRLNARFQPIGRPTVLVNGGVDRSKNPVWIEGPHLFRRSGFYYLIAAEGGTAENHSEVVLRSRTIGGPYEAYAANPILTQRDLPRDRPSPVTSAGHAQLVETPKGDWWSVFLATRPYQAEDYNTGRETFLLPVRWSEGWPRITAPSQSIPLTSPRPKLGNALPSRQSDPAPAAREEFDGPNLPKSWMMLRNPRRRWYHFARGALLLDPRPVAISDRGNPSFVGRRLQHANATIATRLTFDPQKKDDEAGLLALQNDEFWYFTGITAVDGRTILSLRRRAGPKEPEDGVALAEARIVPHRPVDLRIVIEGATARFAYRQDHGTWRPLGGTQDATILSTRRAGGFVGTLIGPYARAGDRSVSSTYPGR